MNQNNAEGGACTASSTGQSKYVNAANKIAVPGSKAGKTGSRCSDYCKCDEGALCKRASHFHRKSSHKPNPAQLRIAKKTPKKLHFRKCTKGTDCGDLACHYHVRRSKEKGRQLRPLLDSAYCGDIEDLPAAYQSAPMSASTPSKMKTALKEQKKPVQGPAPAAQVEAWMPLHEFLDHVYDSTTNMESVFKSTASLPVSASTPKQMKPALKKQTKPVQQKVHIDIETKTDEPAPAAQVTESKNSSDKENKHSGSEPELSDGGSGSGTQGPSVNTPPPTHLKSSSEVTGDKPSRSLASSGGKSGDDGDHGCAEDGDEEKPKTGAEPVPPPMSETKEVRIFCNFTRGVQPGDMSFRDKVNNLGYGITKFFSIWDSERRDVLSREATAGDLLDRRGIEQSSRSTLKNFGILRMFGGAPKVEKRSADSDVQHFLQIYPHTFKARIYCKIVQDHFLDDRLNKFTALRRDGQVNQNLQPAVKDYVLRWLRANSIRLNWQVLINTIMYIVNSMVLRGTNIESVFNSTAPLNGDTGRSGTCQPIAQSTDSARRRVL